MKLTIFYSSIYLSLLAIVWPLSIVQAQITPDNTLGSENSVVTPDVIKGLPSDRIDGGAIRGSNLFQSFQEFNVREGRGAYFSNPTGIANIFSRVTGGNISQILGTLGVSGNANLYFLNPNGIVFGPNARLDVRGAFLATTADSFIFDNNYEFSASNPTAPPLLTVNIPIGLRFRENAGDIVVRTGAASEPVTVTEAGDAGALTDSAQGAGSANAIQGSLDDVNDVDLYQVEVPEGATVTPSTVGGSSVDTRLFLFDPTGLGLVANEDSQGTFQSTLPEINQAGVYYLGISSFANSPESVEGPIFSFSLDDLSIGANAPLSGWDNFGFESGSYTISLSPPAPGTGNLAVPPGQTLALIGGNVRLEGSKILSPGSNVYLGSVRDNGVVALTQGLRPILPNNLLRGEINLVDSEINVRAGGGGSIVLEGRDISMTGGTNRIRAGIEADLGNPEAQGGDITINATGTVYLEGDSLISNVLNNASQGNAGNTYINADLLQFNEGGATSVINSNAQGNGGSIVITVNNLIVEDGTLGMTSFGQGQLGNLQISASNSVSISDSTLGSYVQEGGTGNSGNVEISGKSIAIDNSQIIASNRGNGNAGTIFINGPELVDIANNTLIVSNIGSSSGVASQGNVGNIQIQGGTISVNDSQLQASVYSGGTGTQPGIVNIHATNNISFESSSTYTNVGAGGFGDGGRVEVIVDNGPASFNNDSDIFAETRDLNGLGGDIYVKTQSLSLNNGSDFGSFGSILGGGDAGNATVLTDDFITLDNGSDLNVFSSALGGNVLIQTKKLSLLNGSEIFGSVSGDQPGGTVTINASETVEVSGFIESFPGYFSGSSISVDTIGNGNAGDITINTRQLLVENGGSISSTASGGALDPSISGAGGAITINASESVNVQGTTPNGLRLSTIEASTTGIGKGGDIQINTQQLTVSDGATIQAITTGNGQGGTIEINANSVDVIGTRPPFNVFPTSIDVTTNGSGASGNAGNIRIVTGQLSVRDGAEINASTSNFGQGGNIDIIATESVNISGTYPTFPIGSQIVSQTFGSGQGGTIYVESPTLILNNRGRISSQTSSLGNAGNVIVNAPDSIALGDNSQITVQTSNLGSPGDIAITTDALTIGENAQLSATIKPTSTNTTGGGSIALNVNTLDIRGQLGIFAETQGQAPAGSLTINPNNNPDLNIRFSNNGFISARTQASGKGGNIDISAPNVINISGQGKIITETSGTGNAGVIKLNSQQLNLSDGLEISASTASSGTGGSIAVNAPQSVSLQKSKLLTQASSTGNAGDINLNTAQLNLTDKSAISASSQTSIGGDIALNNLNNLQVKDNSEISASTVDGTAGSLTINTNQAPVNLIQLNQSSLAVKATGTGNSGNLTVNAKTVNLDNKAEISASTKSGAGGDIDLNNLENLQLNNSNISASTATGKAGSISVNANQAVNLNNQANLTVEATNGGTAGDLELTTDQLKINNSQITVSSPTGQAGNIAIQAQDIDLNRGAITAETGKSGVSSGANINLNTTNLLTLEMRNNSLISATANDFADGGNITINTPFLIAFPSQSGNGNDIVAKAFFGDGGRININALGIFGLTERKAIIGNQVNDIDASSEYGAPGIITINQALDPSRGLVTLPSNVVDPNNLIEQNACKRRKQNRSQLTSTGRTDLPQNLRDDFSGSAIQINLVEPVGSVKVIADDQANDQNEPIHPEVPPKVEPAQGWQWQKNGQMVLVGNANLGDNSQRLPQMPKSCSGKE